MYWSCTGKKQMMLAMLVDNVEVTLRLCKMRRAVISVVGGGDGGL